MNNWGAVKRVLETSGSTGVDRLVLIAIAAHINRETGDCFPGKHTIATLANCHPDSIRKSVRRLQNLGELDVDIQGGPGDGRCGRSNLYRLVLPDGEVDSPPEVDSPSPEGDEAPPKEESLTDSLMVLLDTGSEKENIEKERDREVRNRRRSTLGGQRPSGGNDASAREARSHPGELTTAPGRVHDFRRPFAPAGERPRRESQAAGVPAATEMPRQEATTGGSAEETVAERMERLKGQSWEMAAKRETVWEAQ